MIPPIRPTRLRSILRWLHDSSEAVSEEQALALDDQMIDDFETKESSLMESMMAAGTWGTEEGLQSFRTARLAMWEETLAEFLPTRAESP